MSAPFNVLDRHLKLFNNTVIEASAGTGKTFAIENLVVRMVLEAERNDRKLDLERILVVTFTRAATRELKKRIRSHFVKVKMALLAGKHTDELPDYMQAYLEDPEFAAKALRKIDQTLYGYDAAQIFTIHGFCEAMLNLHGFWSGLSVGHEGTLTKTDVGSVVKDFFRTDFQSYVIDESTLKSFGDLEDTLAYTMTNSRAIDPASQQPIAKMALSCQQMLQHYVDHEDKFHADALLDKMAKAIRLQGFVSQIRQQYDVAIIDEFQDTDPVQWSIFKQLFCHADYPGSVYLVGDPKQSIYRFRNADIYSYLDAVTIVGSQVASLDTNYRSQQCLVAALNDLFHPNNSPLLLNLPRQRRSVPYTHVKAAKQSESNEQSQRGAVHFCIAEGFTDKRGAYSDKVMQNQVYFPFITDEILRLRQTEGVQFKQWAVLIHNHRQGQEFADYCRALNIPTIQQKQKKFSESAALPLIQELLAAASNPFDLGKVKMALVSPLFHFTLTQMQLMDQDDFNQWVSLFHQWNDRWKTEGVAACFEAMLNHCAEGMTIREQLVADDQGVLYNEFKQIYEHLSDYEYQCKTTPQQLYNYLVTLGDDASQEEPLTIAQDASQNAVQILTQHMSKGLEFDYVFALGLMNRSSTRRSEEFISVYSDKGQFFRHRDECEDHEREETEEEADAEKLRQLYVAMTRAKLRLYVPAVVLKKLSPTVLKPGKLSPIELFTGHFQSPSATFDYPGVSKGIDRFLGFLETLPKTQVTFSRHAAPLEPPQPYLETVKVELTPPDPVHVPGLNFFLHSFSSLNRFESHPQVILEDVPHDFEAELKSAHTLPAGNETGILLHKILEELPFAAKEIQKAIEMQVTGTLFADWHMVITAIVTAALQAPLTMHGQTFSLNQLDPGSHYREIEFLYPGEGWKHRMATSIKPYDYLQGVIDLAFLHQGKYYLVDWKSNWLGKEWSDYHPDKLKKAMDDHGYQLQAQLYKEAFKRYLKLVDNRPFEEIYGGMFFLFLRGVDLNGNGIYAIEN